MTNRLSSRDAFASAHALLAALRDGQISATALVELHLARITHYNPQLNAIVIPNYEQARRRQPRPMQLVAGASCLERSTACN